MSEFYFTGNDLIEMGFTPGPRFAVMLKEMNAALAANKDAPEEVCDAAVKAVIDRHRAEAEAIAAEEAARLRPMLSAEDAVKVIYNIDANTDEELENLAGVRSAMDKLAAHQPWSVRP